MHKYQYSLDLLRQVIAKAPRFFPSGRRTDMEDALAALERDHGASRETIEETAIAFGKEIWPYRKAFWHIHDTDGRHDETEYLEAALSPTTLEKYRAFVKKGGSIKDVRHGGDFESGFTPEEKQELVLAKLSAHDKVVEGIESLCSGEHKQVCEDALKGYKEEVKRIDGMIAELGSYAEKSEKWRDEILDKVKVFSEGWSGIEREVTAEDVKGEIDYYQGVIDLFE